MSGPDVVVFGGSAGGMQALRGVFETLADVRGAVVCVVLHRSPDPSPLAAVLQSYTALPVQEPGTSPWTCPPGAVTVAPAGYHLLMGQGRRLISEPSTPLALYEADTSVRADVSLDAPVAHSRPSLDVAFESAAQLANTVIAVLLSCANEDGAAGCEAVKAAGGRVVVQDPATCDAPVAVNAAMRRIVPDHVADPQGIGRWLSQNLASGE
ncbi:chemotaxis protein CheB [Mycobacterium sp. ITM-2017-0098]|nr:chemotaxis protein CheB [Mycobacterium sp. ITM-2017-0098]